MRAASSMSRGVEFGRQWEGQTVDGRFPLQRYLGGSASSAVFATLHRNSKAAIKLQRASGAHADAQLTSWRKAAELPHPNLVRIFEVGRCWLAGNELVFIVTECAEENLAEVLPRRALSSGETEQLLRPSLDVLRFLHQRGFVHGHLRPSNVMSVSEQLKLSSDGIRSAGTGELSAGPSTYDAPESRDGKFSPAADVWSLGVTIAEALTQKLPASSGDVLDLPQPFADIVQHCLVQKPEQRWTVKQVSARLQGQTTPASATLEEVPRSNNEKPRRTKQIAIAAFVVVVLALAYMLMHRGSSPSAAHDSASAPPSNAADQPATSSAVSAAAAGSTAGAVLSPVPPNVAASARKTIHGTIKVRIKVNVDASGNVAGAKFITSGPSQYFSRLSMEAARQWKFKPPLANGRAVPSDWTLLFEFTRNGTQEIPQQTSR